MSYRWSTVAPVTVVDRPLLLVDTPSLYFRAYHGIPESAARAPDGSPVNAVRGFLDMMATLIRGRRPDRVICALDADWRPAWRGELGPAYKAHPLGPRGGPGGGGPGGAGPPNPAGPHPPPPPGPPPPRAGGHQARRRPGEPAPPRA